MSQHSCSDFRADLSALLEGDLEPGRIDEIRLHLESCPACRSELELLRLTIGALRHVPDVPPPAGILSGVRSRLEPEPWHRRLASGRKLFVGVPLGALATLLVVLGVSLFQARYPEMRDQVVRNPVPQSPPPLPAPQIASRTAARREPEGRAMRGPLASAPTTAPLPTPVPAPAAPTVPPVPTATFAEPVEQGSSTAPASPVAPVASGAAPGEKRAFDRDAPVPRQDDERAKGTPPSSPAAERAFSDTGNAADRPGLAGTPRQIGRAQSLEAGGSAKMASVRPSSKEELAAMSVRKADSGVVDGGQPRVAEKKAKAPGALRFVCLLPVGGDSVEDLTRFLRREGAGGIEVSRLEPPAVREAFAAQRGRPGVQAEPSEGWMVTAELPSGVLPRLQEALAARTSLRVLQQPPLPAAPSDPSAPQRLNITVLR